MGQNGRDMDVAAQVFEVGSLSRRSTSRNATAGVGRVGPRPEASPWRGPVK